MSNAKFLNSVKIRVKEKSLYMCCVCKFSPVNDVHHIDKTLTVDGGLNTEENAAPLCANCHAMLGENPKKNTFIRTVRDNWFKHNEQYTYLAKEIHGVKDIVTKVSTTLDDLKVAVEKGDNKGVSLSVNTLAATTSFASYSGIVPPPCPNCGEPAVSDLGTTKKGYNECSKCGRAWMILSG